jgi:hypothetical protein
MRPRDRNNRPHVRTVPLARPGVSVSCREPHHRTGGIRVVAASYPSRTDARMVGDRRAWSARITGRTQGDPSARRAGRRSPAAARNAPGTRSTRDPFASSAWAVSCLRDRLAEVSGAVGRGPGSVCMAGREVRGAVHATASDATLTTAHGRWSVIRRWERGQWRTSHSVSRGLARRCRDRPGRVCSGPRR